MKTDEEMMKIDEEMMKIVSRLPKVDNKIAKLYINQQKKYNKPVKPLKDGSYDICPSCKKFLPVKWANVYRNHCGNCGQALDWGKEK